MQNQALIDVEQRINSPMLGKKAVRGPKFVRGATDLPLAAGSRSQRPRAACNAACVGRLAEARQAEKLKKIINIS